MRPFAKSNRDEDRRLTASLQAMAALLVLLVLSLVVVRKLQVRALLEECLMSQQPACEVSVDHLRISRMLERLGL